MLRAGVPPRGGGAAATRAPGARVDRACACACACARPAAPAVAAAAARRRPQRARAARRVVAAAVEHPTAAATQHPQQRQRQQQRGGARATGAARTAYAAQAVAQALAVAAGPVGLGTATANGPHENNEDAAFIARVTRAGPLPGAAAPPPMSLTAALAGCGLKSSDPASGSAAAGGPVNVSGLDDSGGLGGGGGGGGADGGGAGGGVVAHMAAVLDGHGGRGTAKWASRRLPHLIAEHLGRSPRGELTAALAAALRSFDRWWGDAMHDPAISRHGHDDSGSTAALALVAAAPGPPGGWRVAVANLGDSAALLVSRDGGVVPLSETHNTGNPSELDRLLAAGAQVVHPQPGAELADGHARFFPQGPIWGKRGLKVSRALGDVHFKRPAALVSTEPFTSEVLVPPGPGPCLLLLVTDGVTDVLRPDEIGALALAALARPDSARLPGLPRHDDDARAAAAAVVAAAAAHEHAHDNMTCAAVVFGAA